MLRLLVTPPFTQPIAPYALPLQSELAPILMQYGICVVDSPNDADLELCGHIAGYDPGARHLPIERVIIIDGEPAQPEFTPPFYGQKGFAGILTPMNGKVYDSDCLAYYEPPRQRRTPTRKLNRIVQLSTFRSAPGNASGGHFMSVRVNGEEVPPRRVLCVTRVQVGLAIKKRFPTLIDLYGRGWPSEACIAEDSRSGDAWHPRKHEILATAGFDLCWENMEVPCYATEKIWQPISEGVLPLYWGCEQMHSLLPPDTIIDCRQYFDGATFDIGQLVYDVVHMTEAEYCRRVATLSEWHDSFAPTAQLDSVRKAAHTLGAEIQAIALKALC